MSVRSRIVNRRALKRLTILAVLITICLTWAYFSMIRMPGRSFRGDLPPLTPQQSALADELCRDVEMLAGTLAGIEMGLAIAGVPHKKGGVQAALDYLAGAKQAAEPKKVAARS